MTAVVYGKSYRTMPLGEHLPGPTLPVLPPLPTEASPTPRRRRTIVCSNLTINGEQWDVEEAKLKMRDALRADKADSRCSTRPGIHIAADYVLDVCLSSFCRECPFLAATAVAPKRATVAAAPVTPANANASKTVANLRGMLRAKPAPALGIDDLIARVVWLLDNLGLTKADASRLLRRDAMYVADALRERQSLSAVTKIRESLERRYIAKQSGRALPPPPPPKRREPPVQTAYLARVARVRSAMQVAGLSQIDVARLTGDSQGNISSVINAKRQSAALLGRIEASLRVAP